MSIQICYPEDLLTAMISRRTEFLVGTAVLLLAACGCSDDDVVSPESSGPTYSGAFFELEVPPANGEQGSYLRVDVSDGSDSDPEISLRRFHGPGSIGSIADISNEDFDAYVDLAAVVVEMREQYPYGCGWVDGATERVGWFSGESAMGAGIEGCEAQLIEEFRELNTTLVANYFNGK